MASASVEKLIDKVFALLAGYLFVWAHEICGSRSFGSTRHNPPATFMHEVDPSSGGKQRYLLVQLRRMVYRQKQILHVKTTGKHKELGKQKGDEKDAVPETTKM